MLFTCVGGHQENCGNEAGIKNSYETYQTQLWRLAPAQQTATMISQQNPSSKALRDKPVVAQLSKNFSSLYEVPNFVTLSTIVIILSHMHSVHKIRTSFVNILFNIIVEFTRSYPKNTKLKNFGLKSFFPLTFQFPRYVIHWTYGPRLDS